jgi:MerR family redox-sensitive transcriptional activator SoxR
MSELPYDLSVGDVARRSGVTVSALRFYERKGLITSTRAGSNHRRFRRDVLRRIGVIKAAQQLGVPLGTIRDALSALPERHAPSEDDWAALAERWRADLSDRIDRLVLLRDRLTGCIGCGCLSLKLCPLLNPGDRVADQGPGAHFLEPPKPSRLRHLQRS